MMPVTQLHVTIGEYDLKNSELTKSESLSVRTMIIHPDFQCGRYTNDIALLEVGKLIEWSRSVKPACLPIYDNNNYNEFNGKMALAAGWGWLGEDKNICKSYLFNWLDQNFSFWLKNKKFFLLDHKAKILQKVEVVIVKNEVCDEWFASQGKSSRLKYGQMCAGYEEGGRDACGVKIFLFKDFTKILSF